MPRIDARGWISLGCFALTVSVLVMMAIWPALMKDDFFKLIAQAIVLTAWINGPVGWAFQATKTGGELSASNAAIVTAQASASPPVVDTPAGAALQSSLTRTETDSDTPKPPSSS